MPSSKFTNNDFDAFRAYLDDKKREREKVIKAIAEVPVPEAVLDRIVWLGPGDAEAVLRQHPGHKIDETISSLWKMLEVFRRAWRDLSQCLDRFTAFAQDTSSLYRSRVSIVDDIQADVRKEVFCLSCAAMSLVSTSQRLANNVSIPGYSERISSSFRNDPKHNFVKKLRNNLNHGWFASADWMMSFSFGSQETLGEFAFSGPELLHNGDFNELAKQYIRSCGEKINVRNLFSSYAEQVESLYGWLAPVIEHHLPPQVTDYRRCLQARKRNLALCMWRIILSQVAIPKDVDPYLYLDRYLSDGQLAEVMTMEHRSVKQVDRIIELVDEHGACNQDIRQLVYRLFNVAI